VAGSGKHRSRPRSAGLFGGVVALLASLIVGILIVQPFDSGGDVRPGRPTPPGASSGPAANRAPATPVPTSPSPIRARRGSLLIHGTGDVNVQPDYVNVSPSNYGFLLSGLNGMFTRDDLTVVNLECPVSNVGTQLPKEFSFHCDPNALPFLKRGGVDVASMANNHSWDLGPEAVVDTRRNIERAGMAAVGAGRDPRQAEEPAIFHIKGWTVAVVGIDEVVDPAEEVAGPNHPGTACGHDVGCSVRAIRRAAAVSDLVVVIIHWGVELDTQPRDYQVQEAERFVAAGADVIFGSHAHRLQPLGFVHGKPVFWGLGNFVWPHFSEEGSRTAVAEVRVRPNGKIDAKLLPAYIGTSGHPELTG
jgi:poly-gamma-glutamate capsule biosynthesis protein CapA/YwtB (metallophosphatase superfamily)